MTKAKITALLLSIFIISCKKTDVDKKAILLDKTVTFNRTVQYSYDEKDRLISIEEVYQNGRLLYSIVLTTREEYKNLKKESMGFGTLLYICIQ